MSNEASHCDDGVDVSSREQQVLRKLVTHTSRALLNTTVHPEGKQRDATVEETLVEETRRIVHRIVHPYYESGTFMRS